MRTRRGLLKLFRRALDGLVATEIRRGLPAMVIAQTLLIHAQELLVIAATARDLDRQDAARRRRAKGTV